MSGIACLQIGIATALRCHRLRALEHGLSVSRYMVHDASEARRPTRWQVDSALACSPAHPHPWISQHNRGCVTAPRAIL
jgi:hypothetical protein